MTAEFYISNDSFAWNNADSDTLVIHKIESFCDLAYHIHRFQQKNIIYVNYVNGFETTVVCSSGITLSSLIWDRNAGKAFLSRDVYNRFLNAFQNFANQTHMEKEELLQLLDMNDGSCCHAILVLNKNKDFPDIWQVVSTIPEWTAFRRQCLESYPKSGENYLEECEMCFPNLVIHKDNKESLDSFIHTHVSSITRCLSVLNDYFLNDLSCFQGTHPEFVAHFGATYKLDGSSFEGRGDVKFYKRFPDGSQHYCEPHLKINHDDNGHERQRCRIYFEFPPDQSFKIYVGFICRHL